MNSIEMNKEKKLTIIGIIIMVIFTLTKIIPSLNIAGYSVFAGIAFFFIVEFVSKTKNDDSGLRFNSIINDIKKPGVLLFIILGIVNVILTIALGNFLFKDAFVSHVLKRTSSLLSFDKIQLLIGQVIITAWGEEIAFRGFFVGKGMKIMPFWLCAIISSVVFASGHFAAGNTYVVVYDVITIFIDSIIYSIIYHKTNNCMISTLAHILCNATGIIATFIFFM